MSVRRLSALLAALALVFFTSVSQRAQSLSPETRALSPGNGPADVSAWRDLRWRNIGPHRGGRGKSAVGIPDQPNVFYIGFHNGGVWRSDDYGRTWAPLFDDQPSGSVGAIAIA